MTENTLHPMTRNESWRYRRSLNEQLRGAFVLVINAAGHIRALIKCDNARSGNAIFYEPLRHRWAARRWLLRVP